MTDLTESVRLVRGSGAAELFDARTQRKVEEVPFENFIAVAATDHNRQKVRTTFNTGMPTGFTGTDPAPPYPFQSIWLTDSTAAADAATEKFVPGAVLGWASKYTYAGADTQRGTPNAAECAISTTMVKWVFDWPTNAAIGTIGSLCWAYSRHFDAGWMFPVPGLSTEAGIGSPNFGGLAFDPANGDAYHRATSSQTANVYRTAGAGALNTAWPSATLLFSLASSSNDFAIIGDNLWYTMATSPYDLKRVAKAGPNTVLQTIARPWSTTTYGWVTTDGTHLYTAQNASSGSVTLYKIRASDGVTVTSWTLPNGCNGLAWDSGSSTLLVGQLNGNSAVSTSRDVYRMTVVGYSDTGTVKWNAHTVAVPPYTSNYTIVGMDCYSGKLFTYDTAGGNYPHRLQTLGARTALAVPIVKTSSTTLKVTYQFDFT